LRLRPLIAATAAAHRDDVTNADDDDDDDELKPAALRPTGVNAVSRLKRPQLGYR